MPAGFRPQDWFRAFRRRRHFKKRYDVINYFVHSHAARSYLEIGGRSGTCFQRIRCEEKVGVDPNPVGDHSEWEIIPKTSDEFFAANDRKFDVVFIDGLHLAEQVTRDIFNALTCLHARGVVLMHDCNPATERAQTRDESLAQKGEQWNGDVWKVVAFVRQQCPELLCHVVDVDQGIGVIVPLEESQFEQPIEHYEMRARQYFDTLSWDDLIENRAELLGLVAGRKALEQALRRPRT